jgi:hypothetical protein
LLNPRPFHGFVFSSIQRRESFLQAHLIVRCPEILELVNERPQDERSDEDWSFDRDNIVEATELVGQLSEAEQERVGFRESFGTRRDVFFVRRFRLVDTVFGNRSRGR